MNLSNLWLWHRAHCTVRLVNVFMVFEAVMSASFKRPRRVVFVREIPKTASGKILRRVLKEEERKRLGLA